MAFQFIQAEASALVVLAARAAYVVQDVQSTQNGIDHHQAADPVAA